jgi:alpha-tubulin suppressor-like RCC1 family protein
MKSQIQKNIVGGAQMKKVASLLLTVLLTFNSLITFDFTSYMLSNTTKVTSISAGDYSSYMVKDGYVYSWGRNREGQLGDGTFTDRTTPAVVSIPSYISSVSSGEAHVLALDVTGEVFSWGKNYYGELGNNNGGYGTEQNSPVQVLTEDPISPGSYINLDDIVQVAAGGSFSMALNSSGSVYVWGQNNYGQLGTGNTTNLGVATKLASFTNVAFIAAGEYHAIAVKKDGSVYSWGLNSSGQLGNTNTRNVSSPALVSTLSGYFIKKVDCGNAHSIAVDSKGNVWTWGNNSNGQLGDGLLVNKATPFKISSASFNDIVDVNAGQYFSGALKSDGTYYSWGLNSNGELGFNSTPDTVVKTPTSIVLPATFTEIVDVKSGASHSLALKSDGTIYSWGKNSFGQLGLSTITYPTSNVPLVSNYSVSVEIPDVYGLVTGPLSQVEVPINVTFDGNVSGFEFEITYDPLLNPANVASVDKGALIAADPNWVVSYNSTINGIIRIVVYNTLDTPLSAVTDGELVKVVLDNMAVITVNGQSATLEVSDAKASNENGELYPISNIDNGEVYFWSLARGDLITPPAGIDILDVNRIVDIILRTIVPSPEEIYAADYNMSGSPFPTIDDVTISDAILLLYDILNP